MNAPEEVDAELVVGSELAHREIRREVIRPLDVADQANAMAEYQAGLRSILDASDWQDAGRGESFVKKSGFRKIAAWFNLTVELVRDEVERDESGQVLRASVIARAIAPNGRAMDGDGYCSAEESRFKRNASKLENDLRATASTRATNRAISGLVAMGAVSAEEVTAGIEAPPPPAGPPFGPAAAPGLLIQTRSAIAYATGLESESPQVDAVIQALTNDAGGYVPRLSARAVCCLAGAIKAGQQEGPTE